MHSIFVGNPPGPPSGTPGHIDLRRAVSALYYGVFHPLSEAAVQQIAPFASPKASNRIHRRLNHTEMKKVFAVFTAPDLKLPLRDLLDSAVSVDLQTVAINFIKLQEARHNADYDLDYQLSWERIERAP